MKSHIIIEQELPESFSDIIILSTLNAPIIHDIDQINNNKNNILYKSSLNDIHKTYQLTCGLLLKLRTAIIRIEKRNKYRPPQFGLLNSIENRYFFIVKSFVNKSDKDILMKYWLPVYLWETGVELSVKVINLSPDLQKELHNHKLLIETSDTEGKLIIDNNNNNSNNNSHIDCIDYSNDCIVTKLVSDNSINSDTNNENCCNNNDNSNDNNDNNTVITTKPILKFDLNFLRRVRDFHRLVQRPVGTFDLKVSNRLGDKLLLLSSLSRETCNSCNSCRQVS